MKTTKTRPRIVMSAAAATLMTAAVMASPQSARAATSLVTCNTGTYSFNLRPGLTITDRSFTLSGTGALAGCVSPPVTGDPAVNGNATATLSGSGSGSCTSGASAKFTTIITWANRQTSTQSGTATMKIVNGVPVFTLSSTTTAGKFAGSTVAAVPTIAFNPADCATPQGVTRMNGTLTAFTVLGV
ncbi:hypothetical protein [Actinoallomurus soli]|uniref:hypothetical protein n=1 Tax=Actinoallomurus soli TaxID=2952535 RepID=UPI002091F526|nr:hypothetical protein [Actinoallomurus soli]MCO5973778.1 hypothetical protein [Actinoallomurus soli]